MSFVVTPSVAPAKAVEELLYHLRQSAWETSDTEAEANKLRYQAQSQSPFYFTVLEFRGEFFVVLSDNANLYRNIFKVIESYLTEPVPPAPSAAGATFEDDSSEVIVEAVHA